MNFFIYVSSGNSQSVSLSLDNDHVYSGRSNKIHYSAIIHQDESESTASESTLCGPWKLHTWISPTNNPFTTDNEIQDPVTQLTQVLTNKQRNYEFEDGSSSLVFENVTYMANLNHVICKDVNFMCVRFQGRRGDVNCTSQMTSLSSAWSCIAINCRGKSMI